MTYMDKLQGIAYVAANRAADMDALGYSMVDIWTYLEHAAQSISHDIFEDPDHEAQTKVRGHAWSLVRLLYMVPGADCELDVSHLRVKNEEYGGSWIKRGGRGAFFMLARKWDRVRLQLDRNDLRLGVVLANDTRPEGVLDDLGDLRRYLLLCLAYWADLNDDGPLPIKGF